MTPRSSNLVQIFGSEIRIKNNDKFKIYSLISNTVAMLKWNNAERHTKSSTRQNSGVLRVFSGKAGAFRRISSVSGGKFLMKQYLHNTTPYPNTTTLTADIYDPRVGHIHSYCTCTHILELNWQHKLPESPRS